MRITVIKNNSTHMIIKCLLIMGFIFLYSGFLCYSQIYTSLKAESRIRGASRVDYENSSELPDYIKMKKGSEVNFSEWQQWLSQNLNLSPEIGFVLKSTERDNRGEVHYRYAQTYLGNEIFEKEYIVHTKDGKVFAFNGDIIADMAASNSKTLTESQALAKALSFLNAQQYKWENPVEEAYLKKFSGDPLNTYYPDGKLCYMPDKDDSSFRMAYMFDIYAQIPTSRSYVFVDAGNGEILLELDRLHRTDVSVLPVTPYTGLQPDRQAYASVSNTFHCKYAYPGIINANAMAASNPAVTVNVAGLASTKYSGIQTIITDFVTDTVQGFPYSFFRLRETVRGNGIETYNMQMTPNYGSAVDFTDTDNYWDNVNAVQDEAATDAHWGAEKTYDYFQTVFNRNSIDNMGFKLVNYVHANLPLIDPNYGNNYNAFWNGSCMTYGDGNSFNGPMVALDIIGHEITHGLDEKTCNLTYWGESGALNEGFCDIFATCIEHFAKPAEANWIIAEDVGSVRSLSDPKLFGRPDTYQGNNWLTGNGDRGGVHYNCGVLARWFYLLSEGGAGVNDKNDTYDVTGIGIDDASWIAYRTMTVYLTPGSNYKEVRKYSLISAADLFGECSEAANPVLDAWFAVGVGSASDSAKVQHNSIKCEGDSNGWAAVIIKRGNPNEYDFVWSTSPTDTIYVITNLTEGQYSVTYTNALGCEQVIDFEMELSMTTLPTSITGLPEGCDNTGDGTATAMVSGGSPPYSYEWSNGDTTATITGLSEGTYSVTVSDTNGCYGNKSILLEVNYEVDTVEFTSTPPSCFGQNNGTATASTSGGPGPYTFLWSNGATGPSVSGLAAGTYTVSVTDSEGCHGKKSVTINDPQKLTLSIGGGNTFITYCNNTSPPSTTLTATASGGRPPYNYSWPGGSHTIAKSGRYCCSVTDTNGCNASTCVFVLFIPVKCSKDPNIIIGPAGYAEEQWVSVRDRLSYTVWFENDPVFATAPAQDVRISIPLNETIDMNSLQLGDFGFGNNNFLIPPNTSYYSKRLDLTDSLGVFVDIIAGLDVVNQEAFWIFQSIDPATGLPPNDPQTGFLPVNDTNTHLGEGFVTFTIKPKSSDITGDSVLAQAKIVFDINESINTNKWFNKVDAVAPTSSIDTLILTSPSSLDILFSGQDDPGGCGIQEYMLYYSRDAGPYYLFGEYTFGDTASLSGIENSEYRFFSIAKDYVGNTEPMKNMPEETIVLGYPRLISGTVTYQNNANTPVGNALVYLRHNDGTKIDSVSADQNGAYDFGYKAQKTYLIDAFSDFPWGGVNSTDALLVRRASIGLSALNSLQDSAADVNHTNSISSTDALLIRKRVVGQIDNFQIQDIVFLKDALIVADSNITHEIKTLCAGDVNGSFTPVLLKSSGIDLFRKGEIFTNRNQDIDLPVICEHMIQPAAVTLILDYPGQFIDVKSISSSLPGFLYSAKNEKIIIAWDSLSPAIFNNNDVLCVLHLTVSEDASDKDNIVFALDARSEFADKTAEVMHGIRLSYPEVRITQDMDFELNQNHPNPFAGATEIGYVLPEDGNVVVKAYDVLGQEVGTLVSTVQKAGKYTIRFDGSGLKSGAYFYKIAVEGVTRNFNATRSMIIIADR